MNNRITKKGVNERNERAARDGLFWQEQLQIADAKLAAARQHRNEIRAQVNLAHARFKRAHAAQQRQEGLSNG